MYSTSDSRYEERCALREALCQYAARPNLFGSSEDVEELAKHVTHVLLMRMHGDAWRLEYTEKFWRNIASDLGFGDRCSQDEEAHRIRRWWAWGSNETASRAQVVAAFMRIWAKLSGSGRNFLRTRQWIKKLLEEPQLAGPPDILEVVLWNLMYLLFAPDHDLFNHSIDEERRRAGGGSFRGLADIGTEKEWGARTPDEMPDYISEPRVSVGIREALRRLDLLESAADLSAS